MRSIRGSRNLRSAVTALATERRPQNVTGNALDGDRLMTLQEVCDFLQIEPGTARKQRSEGRFIPAYRIGKHLRFRRSAVLEWLESKADEV